ncbi:MAG: D-alanine--D-alanine ligase family protein [Myxococcota bacterium]|jgi:D-alanine-D-alanine ligase
MKKAVELLVIFGGRSGEHEVSLRSAVSIIGAARKAGFAVTPAGIDRDGSWFAESRRDADMTTAEDLPAHVLRAGYPAALIPSPSGAKLVAVSGNRRASDGQTVENERPLAGGEGGLNVMCMPDAVFPVLHGTYGEDGTIQGLFEMCSLPYVGPGVLGSSVAMDKIVAKRVMRDAGLEIVPFVEWRRGGSVAAAVNGSQKQLGWPVFVKPANMGSSVGISRASNARELKAALALAAQYDRKVLIEKAVDAREIECAVLGNDGALASLPGEVVPVNEFYDYEAKYLKDGSKTEVPARIPKKVADQVRLQAVKAFEAVGCEGMARVDFFLERGTGKLFVNELNTIPGFTSISMYPMMWKSCGLPYPKLIKRLVELAVERFEEVSKNRTSFAPGR